MTSLKRLVFIINKLIEKPHSARALQDLLLNEEKIEITVKHLYEDIKNLKEVGFEIVEIPRSKISGKTFKINKLPFKYSLSEPENNIIKDIFNSYSNNFIELEELFLKFSSFLDFELQNLVHIEKNEKRSDLYLKVKQELNKAKSSYKKVSFEYKKPNSNEVKTHKGYVFKIDKDEKKIERVLIYNDKKELYIDFNIERISSVPIILDKEPTYNDFRYKYAKFEIYPPVAKAYHKTSDEEELTEENSEVRIIKTRFYTNFRLIRKLLKYGEYVKIIEPEEAKKEIKKIIKKMNEIYQED